MFSFDQLYMRRAFPRAKQLLANGDLVAARAEMEKATRRFPRSLNAWMARLWVMDRTDATLEERLDVLRAANKAIPYDIGLVDSLTVWLQRAWWLIGDRSYQDEAVRVVDALDELLGPSVGTLATRAALAQGAGDEAATLEYAERAIELLEREPDLVATYKLGLCLASIPGREARGLDMAESAARRLKATTAFLYLAALVEDRDPERARGFLQQAETTAAGRGTSTEALQVELEKAREDVRTEREHLKALKDK